MDISEAQTMIRALLTGTLYGEPQARTSQIGKPFTTAKRKGDGKDGASVWCSLIAFGEQAEWLGSLPANSALSVSGRCELSAWLDRTGNPAAGLSLVVAEIATIKGKPKPQGETPRRSRPQGRPAPSPALDGAGVPFDDDLSECFR